MLESSKGLSMTPLPLDEYVEESPSVVCEDAPPHPPVELESFFWYDRLPVELIMFDEPEFASEFSFAMADDPPKPVFPGPFLVEEPA